MSVPQQDWLAIDGRVSVVVGDGPLAQEITTVIANFDALLAACQTWTATTFPGLLAQAVQTGTFAGDALQALTKLQQELAGLQPGDPVPAGVTFIVTVELQSLADSASTQVGTASTLQGQVQTFVAQNQAADTSMDRVLAPGWEDLTDPSGDLATAMGDVTSGWGAIGSQLQTLATQPVNLPELLAVDLQAAVTAWSALGPATEAFVQAAQR